MLYQLSYSHRHADYTTAIPYCQKRQASPSSPSGDGAGLPRLGRDHSVLGQKPAAHGTQYCMSREKGSTKQGEGETVEERSKDKIRACTECHALLLCRGIENRGLTHPRPTPTYSNPMARIRTESRRFLVSTIMGFFSSCLMRSKSSARNSGQPVPTTSASMPSAAA